MADHLERELKLVPLEPELLGKLAAAERLGDFEVTGRRRERQHNSFFDTPSKGLARVRVGFRRRTVDGLALATWSLKGDSRLATQRGVAMRSEIEVKLDQDTPPVLALSALRQAAQLRGAVALAEQVADGLADGGLPGATPYLETATDRQIVDLEERQRGWQVELALDSVRLLGHQYEELEIEAELKHGDEAALGAAREAIESVGQVRDSQGSKLSRARAHLENCECQR